MDLRGNIPSFLHITDGKWHDVNILDHLMPKPGAFYVMDRAYLDFALLYRLHAAGSFFVTHDLRVARYLCDRIAVMFFGRLVEIGPTADIFARPRHPYTRQLLATLGDSAESEAAAEPAPPADAAGCRYRSRCAHADATCAQCVPQLVAFAAVRQVACHYFEKF